MAEVVVLVVDATEGLHDQDLQIAQLIEREGRACVLALNKWDAVADRTATRRAHRRPAGDQPGAAARASPVVTLSALTGAGMEQLLPAVRRAHAVWNTRVPTGELNRWFEQALERHPPPLVRRAAAEAALHHAGQGAAADLRRVRHAGGADAGGLPALSGEQPARGVRAAGHADPAAVARHEQPVRADLTLPINPLLSSSVQLPLSSLGRPSQRAPPHAAVDFAAAAHISAIREVPLSTHCHDVESVGLSIEMSTELSRELWIDFGRIG